MTSGPFRHAAGRWERPGGCAYSSPSVVLLMPQPQYCIHVPGRSAAVCRLSLPAAAVLSDRTSARWHALCQVERRDASRCWQSMRAFARFRVTGLPPALDLVWSPNRVADLAL